MNPKYSFQMESQLSSWILNEELRGTHTQSFEVQWEVSPFRKSCHLIMYINLYRSSSNKKTFWGRAAWRGEKIGTGLFILPQKSQIWNRYRQKKWIWVTFTCSVNVAYVVLSKGRLDTKPKIVDKLKQPGLLTLQQFIQNNLTLIIDWIYRTLPKLLVEPTFVV